MRELPNACENCPIARGEVEEIRKAAERIAASFVEGFPLLVEVMARITPAVIQAIADQMPTCIRQMREDQDG